MNESYKFENIPLPYGYNGLEPYIDGKTMELHHGKHLQNYINKLNALLEPYPYLQNKPLDWLVKYAYTLPEALKIPVAQNAGGVYNHFFYFEELSDNGNSEPAGEFKEYLEKYYPSFAELTANLASAALSVFGSGYAWLAINRRKAPVIVTTPNQMTTLTEDLYPLANIDVWEHAYYLKHYNDRAGYIADWFKVADWRIIGERFNALWQ